MIIFNIFEGPSAGFAHSILEQMSKLGVGDEYIAVTKAEMVPHYRSARNHNKKIIYFAYDSESKVFDQRGWLEMKHLTETKPELIVVVSKVAYDFYNKFGLNVHYLPMGYDAQTKPLKNKKIDISFVGTIDDWRSSIFYYRHMLGKILFRAVKQEKYTFFFGNKVAYNKVPSMYSNSIVGINDVARGMNMRCWEIPVNGAFMLVNPTIRNSDYPLKEGKHYMVYDDPIDLVVKVKYLLDDREKTIEMGLKAREEALKYPIKKNIVDMIKKWKLGEVK